MVGIDCAQADDEVRLAALPVEVTGLRLTAREQQVLHWLATGHSNADIALCLCRSEKTVKNLLTCLYAKLGAVNRAQAVAVFLSAQSVASH